jgi:predicted membrane-bound dolichyl-phosphate-mannose-protein mannosyltransferase
MCTRRTSRGRRDLPLSWRDVPGTCEGGLVDVVGAVAGAGATTCEVVGAVAGAETPLAVALSAGGVRG